MITRKTQIMNTAIQLYKHDNQVFFRIFAQIKPFSKHLTSVHDIYELIIDLKPPYGCWLNKLWVRNFGKREIAFSILLERVRSLCSQFGFSVPYKELRKWEAED